MYRIVERWIVGDYTMFEVRMNHSGDTLYGFSIGNTVADRDKPQGSELYVSLDMAMIACIGEKYTGPRGANGRNVDTAAGWFAKMIGMPTD
jgi:hypothetical protein